MDNDGTMYNAGSLVGYFTGNSLDEFYMDQIGGQIHIDAPNVSNVGLIGLSSFSGTVNTYVTNWYSQVTLNTATIVTNMGAITGTNNSNSISYILDAGWAVIEYPSGESEENNIRPITGNESAYTTVYDNTIINSETFPSTDPWNEYVLSNTAEMLSGSPFSGFDFDTVWTQAVGSDYPRFVWAAGEAPKYIFWLFHTPKPTPVLPENEITEFRAGKIMNFRIYDTAYDPPMDISDIAEVKFLPIPGSDVDPLWQVYADPDIKWMQVDTSGTLSISITKDRKTAINTFEVYGPDFFSHSESLAGPLTRNLLTKATLTAHYRDGFEEKLTPLKDFITSPDETILIEEDTVKATELGPRKLKFKRFMTEEIVDIEVEPMETPELVDVINTAARLYIFFRLNKKIDVDTYFVVRAFHDEARTRLIKEINTIDNTDDFTVTMDGGGSFSPISQAALSPTGTDAEMYCARIDVGPLEKVFVDLGIMTGDETEDIYAPIISADPPPGVYNKPVVVDFSINEPGDIFFTYTDGVPDITYQEGEPILLVKTNTLRVRATDKKGNVSKIASFKYVVDAVAPIVSITPTPGEYMEAIDIEMSANEVDTTIFYTTDDTIPTDQSSIYTVPLRLESGTLNLKAIGVDAAGNRSDVVEASYEIIDAVKGDSFTNPAIYNGPLGTVQSYNTFGMINDFYVRYDDFVPGAQYTAQFVDVPEEQGGGSGIGVHSDTQDQIVSGWIMMPITFTATSQSMYILAYRGTNHWDPVKLVITKS